MARGATTTEMTSDVETEDFEDAPEDGDVSDDTEIPGNPADLDLDSWDEDRKEEYGRKYQDYNLLGHQAYMQRSRRRKRRPHQRPAAEEVEVDIEVEANGDNIGEEPAPIRVQKLPCAPTAAEIAAHKITHLPHRDWCPVYKQGAAKTDTGGRKPMRARRKRACTR